ncbi:XdhC family aldehyde oxidoreductase maturation factor [Geobacter sp.]|uniref:XdhC family aldehyde oxidoreductase maturation factor n=1 Tax=Geobacter sp. TaxID=46610 RepID=UPI00262B2085|nr:XdhC family protein [Geobacter sp.]
MLISWAVDAIWPVLERGEELVLATIIAKSGSAPCLAGSKMIVHGDETSVGTIGGGVLEAEGQRRAGEVFRTGVSQIFTFDLSGRDAASMSMICGGRVEVFLELIDPDPVNLEVFRSLREALRSGEKCFVVSDLGEYDGDIRRISRCIVRGDGSVTGEFHHPAEWLATLAEQAHRSTYPVLATLGARRFLVERCYTPSTVYILGAGHVSQHVAELAGKVSFHTVVMDDREEFANRERFPTAGDVIVLDSFTGCFAGMEVGGDSYVVIVTRGHTHDRVVLEQALRTKAGYIGMLGSRKKSVEIRKALLAEGFGETDVNRFNCPIGLKIGAETTAEIAVSIVAELIQARANQGE